MSKLAELLVSRGVTRAPANPANPANPEGDISRISNISTGAPLDLPPDFERRIHAMAKRWQYTEAELVEVLDRARRDPAGWARAVALDERREHEFRERGLLPRADA